MASESSSGSEDGKDSHSEPQRQSEDERDEEPPLSPKLPLSRNEKRELFHRAATGELECVSKGHLPGGGQPPKRRVKEKDVEKISKSWFPAAKQPLNDRDGRITFRPPDFDVGEGRTALCSMRPKLQDPCWRVIKDNEGLAKRVFNHREHCAFHVPQLMAEAGRAISCLCSHSFNSEKERKVKGDSGEATAAGLRCSAERRCDHCAGTCACDWKFPMEDLIEHGAEVNGHNWKGETALHAATQAGNVRVVAALLQWQADPTQSDQHGWTPLHEAVRKDRPGICDALLEALPEIAEEEGTRQMLLEKRSSLRLNSTALLEAVIHGHSRCLTVLLDYRASVNARLEDGKTALMLASSYGNIDACRLLLSCGCTVCGGPAGRFKTADPDAPQNRQRSLRGIVMGDKSKKKAAGCKGRCTDRLHAPLKDKNHETAVMLARHKTRDRQEFFQIVNLLESHGCK
mmetsp:Transcript_81342/g.143538  ORF Transcript_81342/g.143538 Transcript_81342/m.143538 type:complete len:458 (+) Transcript_81342:30-1403(+)